MEMDDKNQTLKSKSSSNHRTNSLGSDFQLPTIRFRIPNPLSLLWLLKFSLHQGNEYKMMQKKTQKKCSVLQV